MFTKRLRFFGFIFFTVLLFQPVFSQFQINHFTTDNGLPSNGIKGLQWDETTGFLWIATEAGLVRYNGMSFKTFDINSNPELGSNRIVTIVKNTAGKILVSGQTGNLSIIKENTISFFFKGGDSVKYNYGHFGAITASDTLFRQCFNLPWKVGFDYLKVLPLNDTACITFVAGQLYYYSVSTTQPVKLPTASSYIQHLFKIGNLVYYLDSLQHLFLLDVYNRSSDRQEMIDMNGNDFVIQNNNSKLFWQQGVDYPVLVQDGKAWIVENTNLKRLRFKLIATGIPENVFFNYALYLKKANYLFLGTASKGVYVIHRNEVTTKHPAKLNINQQNAFYSQVELPNGNILTNNGIIIGENASQNNYNIDNHFLNNLFDYNDSLLIFGTPDSLFMYNRNNTERKLFFATNTNGQFCFAFSGKQLYFANQKGIAIVTAQKQLHFVKLFDNYTSNRMELAGMTEISPGKLAMATCDGLLSFDTNTKQIDTLLKIPAVCIRNLYKVGDYIFIGTYGGGFYVMKNGRIKAMPLDINQYLKYTHCFLKDKNGFCWISTNNGLFKVKLSDIIEAYEKNLSQIYYHYLGKEDGMQTTEMNGGCTPCALRLKNDNLSFPTMDGMVWFNPEKTILSLPAGNINIDKIIVDGKQKYFADKELIQLPEDIKKIDLSFAVNAWCRKENLYIDYKLNNDKWLTVYMAADAPGISFSNLSYGTYILTIRKMNGFGIGNYSYSTITFKIATPFYHRWWFRILGLLPLIGISYLIFQLRLRQYNIRERKLSAMVEEKTMDLNLKNLQLEKNDQIKTRLISVINHDIITPLKFMHYAGKALVENKGLIDPKQQLETISDITQTAKDMEMLSSQILNWIIYQNPNERMQKEEFDLHQLVEMVFGVLQFPAKLKHTQLQNNVPANFVIYQYMEPLRVLIYNLVLNSINFTKEGMVSVKATAEKEKLILVVIDNGLGMTKEQIDNLLSDDKIIASANVDNKKGTGLGYMIIKDLLKMMGGLLSIESSKSNGTNVLVSLHVK